MSVTATPGQAHRLVATIGVAALVTALAAVSASVAPQAGAQQPPPNAVCPADTPDSGFVDRDDARTGHAASIDCVAFHGIALGSRDADGQRVYLPADTVNRAQMATFIANTLEAAGHDLPDGDAPDDFTDTATTVHRSRINALARAGIASGYPDDSFRPQAPVTRGQMATFVVQAVAWATGQPLEADAGPHFADTTGGTHEANIDAGFEAGLYEGRVAPDPDVEGSGRFAPLEGTRRDQMATFLSRLLDHLWDTQGIAGYVTDADSGEPIAGAEVAVYAEPLPTDPEPVSVETTGDSGFYFADLDPGTYTVTATAQDYLDTQAHTGVVVEAGHVTVALFALQPVGEPDPEADGTIAGEVTEAAEGVGDPIPGATVSVLDGDAQIAQTTTGSDGGYTLDVPAGTYTVTATAAGFEEGTEEDAVVETNQTTTVNFALSASMFALLTADPELAPTSDDADPSISSPSRGDVVFTLQAWDGSGLPHDPQDLTYTFEIYNEGTGSVEICIFCGDNGTAEIMTVPGGGYGEFRDVPELNQIRVDSHAATSVAVTAYAEASGEEAQASAGASWFTFDEAPTGTGIEAAHSGTLIAFDSDRQWYLIDAEGDMIYVEYTGGTSNTYFVGAQPVDVHGFQEALEVGSQLDYSTHESGAQVHFVWTS